MRSGLNNLIVYSEFSSERSEILHMAVADLGAGSAASLPAKGAQIASFVVDRLASMAPGRRGLDLGGYFGFFEIQGAVTDPIDMTYSIQAIQEIFRVAQARKVQIDDVFIDNEVFPGVPGNPPSPTNAELVDAFRRKVDALSRGAVISQALAIRPEPHLGKVYPAAYNYFVAAGARPMPSVFTDLNNPTGDLRAPMVVDGKHSAIWGGLTINGFPEISMASPYTAYQRHWAWNAIIDFVNFICSAHAGGYTCVITPRWMSSNAPPDGGHRVASLPQIDRQTSRRQWAVAMNIAADLGVRKWVLFNSAGTSGQLFTDKPHHDEENDVMADLFRDIDARVGGAAPRRIDIGDTPRDAAQIVIGKRRYTERDVTG